MTLAAGIRVGTYEIVALIGAGGMGEVYRARDGRLTRDVALKTLPETFARDPERLARFTREANLLAALNHPNIAAIYGFESSGHVPALVLEMVEGPTLAERIDHGRLPLDEALPIARQIADALECAHAQGIVHRDLKPANVKVRQDGTVKVLDFGLAKALTGDSSPAVAAASPTITSPAATAMGTIMGTAVYMSPEQARGRAIDKRSDIWSFGAVLYEMLTGKRAFDGEDVSDTLANILKRDPDWTALPPETPPAIERVLRRCLVKDPRLRTHDIADVRIELDDRAAGDPAFSSRVVPDARSRRLKMGERVAWALVPAALTAVAVYQITRAPSSAPTQVLRFQIQPPDKHEFGFLGGPGSRYGGTDGGVLSPDGTRVVFSATDQSGRSALWLRMLDSFEARQLPATERAYQPFWSPDGQFVGFFAERKLYRVDAVRGEPREICGLQGSSTRGAAWGTDGVIIFATSNPATIMRVPSEGGTPTPLRLPHTAETFYGAPSWPWFLPDGRRFLYWTRTNNEEDTGVHVASIDPGFTARQLVPSETQAVFVAPGYLLFGRGTQLLRQRFDPGSLELTGQAAPIVDQLRTSYPLGFGEFSASNTGVLTYRTGTPASNQFAWLDRAGKTESTVGPPGTYRTPALSPDGRRLAYTDMSDGNLKILDLQRQLITLFTSDPGSEAAPVWSPDGTRIYYRSDGGGVFVKDATGTSAATKIFGGSISGPSQVIDHPALGSVLLHFGVLARQPSQDILVLPLRGERVQRAIVSSPFPEVEPQISPDGNWLAYVSSENGRNEVYLQPFPLDGRIRWQVSTQGGRQPMWRADSRELFFVSDDRRFYAVSTPENSQSFDEVPRLLFEMRANVFNTRNSYVPRHDGQRFIVNTVLDTAAGPISVIYNWPGDGK
jgi:serine/threonine protein kinase/Tol biopolymer transport system component